MWCEVRACLDHDLVMAAERHGSGIASPLAPVDEYAHAAAKRQEL
jgi:hypothetical protein